MKSNYVYGLIGICAYFGFKQVGFGGGGEMPKSMLGYVRQAEVLDKKLVVLITGSDWCPACKTMESEMLRTAEWQDFAAKEVLFQKYEFPAGGTATTPVHQDLLKLAGFGGFPTMVVADGKGKVLEMKVGYGGGAGQYIKWIKSL